ncbi:hypothetical protein [Alkalicoccobacillus plakortidis]|uniref:Uncharacterized protein n=1 Tax=Alkalicoccobacillus plakortidis TaxID=444060 RepID=A0ABT0XDS0_9BACI|nr:hypothetical protein [Alkalicoccobacillus plakortidis]MCM2674066.1 hypothetical protein [Alkalicoccobacillus plakortidis]
MKVQCIDVGETTTLTEGNVYFLYPNGSEHAYISKFDNPSAHFGCYRKSLFEKVFEDAPVLPLEPPELNWELESGQVYKAYLTWVNMPGAKHMIDQSYFVRKHPRHRHQVSVFEDPECTSFRAILSSNYFRDYELIESDAIGLIEEEFMDIEELPAEDWEQMSLF